MIKFRTFGFVGKGDKALRPAIIVGYRQSEHKRLSKRVLQCKLRWNQYTKLNERWYNYDEVEIRTVIIVSKGLYRKIEEIFPKLSKYFYASQREIKRRR